MLKFISYLLLVVIIQSTHLLANERPIETERPSIITSIANSTAKMSAKLSINLAELIASDAAKAQLKKFRTGSHTGAPKVYEYDSLETKELFEGDYYQELNEHLVTELAQWYDNKIPVDNGLFMQGNTFRVFSPNDAIIEMLDGIDLADITGTFTYHIRATTKNGIIYFMGINQISLESYSGENYLRHGLVNNPDTGPFSSTTLVYRWQHPIPEHYKQ